MPPAGWYPNRWYALPVVWTTAMIAGSMYYYWDDHYYEEVMEDGEVVYVEVYVEEEEADTVYVDSTYY